MTKFKSKLGLAGVALLTVILAACAQAPTRERPVPPPDAPEVAQEASEAETGKPAGGGPAKRARRDRAPDEPAGLEPIIKKGTGEFIDREAARPEPRPAPPEGQITLNFEGQDIREIVKVILGDILGMNYVIAPGVGGKATFSTARPVTRDQVLPILEMLLSWNNAALVYADGRWNVVPQNQAIPGNLVPRLGDPPEKGYAVRAVPLEYIAPSQMAKLLEPFARKGAIVMADDARGLLVLSGTPEELENYMATIEIFDVNWLEGMSVGVFPLTAVKAEKVVEQLQKVFGAEAKTPLAGMFRFMPMENLNAVLVITPQPDYLAQAREWIERFDQGLGAGGGVRLYVYRVKNVKATDLAETLNDVFGGGGGDDEEFRRAVPQGGVAPGLESVEITAINEPDAEQPEPQPRTARPTGPGRGLALVGGEEIEITAVESSNSLLIRATPAQYQSILGAIERLDVIPLQVLVEAKIIEVSLTDSLQYGVQWYFQNAIAPGNIPGPGDVGDGNGDGDGDGDDNGGGSLPEAVGKGLFERDEQTGFFGAQTGGLTYAFTGPNAQVVLTALASESEFRVISAPSLMVMNNKEARIQVGNQIPVVTTRFNPIGSGVGTSTIGSVQFRDTGVILTVTPRVNPGGLVFLEIEQELSQVTQLPELEQTANVPLSKRQIKTELAVQSGQTVVLGGLISETRRESDDGVPILKDIPLIGALFGSEGQSGERRELLVLITPTVIYSSQQAVEVTEEYRSKFKGLEPIDIEDYNLESDELEE